MLRITFSLQSLQNRNLNLSKTCQTTAKMMDRLVKWFHLFVAEWIDQFRKHTS